MKTKVKKWGNSLAFRIPGAVALEVGIEPDDDVELTVNKGKLVLSPLRSAKYQLSYLLKGVTKNNRHKSVDEGPAVGGEAW